LTTSSLVLETSVVLDHSHRSTTTREPGTRRAPSIVLVRDATTCAWAINADVSRAVAVELDALARDEPAGADWQARPRHERRYVALLAGERIDFGPDFGFPERLPDAQLETCVIDDEQMLAQRFHGWVPGEIAAGRAPVLAIVQDGAPVSVCFCARLSDVAAEAGVETAAGYRGRGLAPQVVAAWARAMRERDRTPLYSTSWMNRGSLAVARKLALHTHASIWSSWRR
jgi:hypothetical protein